MELGKSARGRPALRDRLRVDELPPAGWSARQDASVTPWPPTLADSAHAAGRATRRGSVQHRTQLIAGLGVGLYCRPPRQTQHPASPRLGSLAGEGAGAAGSRISPCDAALAGVLNSTGCPQW